MDHLYVRVPRLCEREPGFVDSEAMEPSAEHLTVSGATFDPLARRWLGTPYDEAAGSGMTEWDCTRTLVEMSLLQSGGTGVEVTAEDWRATRKLDLGLARGWYLDLWCYEPAGHTHFGDPVVISWGGTQGYVSGTTPQPKWRITLTPGDSGPGMAEVAEWDGTAWAPRITLALLTGTFFNQLHRIWCQPLDDDEWLLRNRDVPDMGAVIRTTRPHIYDPDAGSDTDDGPPEARVPWGPGPMVLSGYGRAWWVWRALTYPAAWSVQTKGERGLGFLSTQAVDVDVSAWLPDGKYPKTETEVEGIAPGGSDYDWTLTVFAGELKAGEDDPPSWTADPLGQREYSWRLSVTGPEDAGSGTVRATRTVCVDRLLLGWGRTLADDGSTQVDLVGHETIGVLALRESRGYRDSESTLDVTLHGPTDTLRDLVRPGLRWRWVLELAAEGEESQPYIRFDGIRDQADQPRWTTVAGDWRSTVTVGIRTRWRQAESVLFRGQTVIDGLLRSTAYAELAKLLPLDTAEIVIPTPLPDDKVLPAARRGEKPLWKPEIGQPLAGLIWGLQEALGPNDRLMFRDHDGVAALVIDRPSRASAATFYRTQTEADAAGVPAQSIGGPEKDGALSLIEDDSEFANEVIVIGMAPAPAVADRGSGSDDAPKRGKILPAYFSRPDSWQTAEIGGAPNRKYVGYRRVIYVYDPQLTTQAAVDLRCRQLVERYFRWSSAGHMQAGFVHTLYPGDVVTVDAGTEPGASAQVLEVRGMTTDVINLSLPAARRCLTNYELGEVPG